MKKISNFFLTFLMMASMLVLKSVSAQSTATVKMPSVPSIKVPSASSTSLKKSSAKIPAVSATPEATATPSIPVTRQRVKAAAKYYKIYFSCENSNPAIQWRGNFNTFDYKGLAELTITCDTTIDPTCFNGRYSIDLDNTKVKLGNVNGLDGQYYTIVDGDKTLGYYFKFLFATQFANPYGETYIGKSKREIDVESELRCTKEFDPYDPGNPVELPDSGGSVLLPDSMNRPSFNPAQGNGNVRRPRNGQTQNDGTVFDRDRF